MKHIITAAVATLCWSLVRTDVQLVDLSHPFGHKTIYWPGNPPFNFTNAFTVKFTDKVIGTANYFQTAEHSGTHMDAPLHFCKTGKKMHEISLEKLNGPGVVMDFTAQAEKNVDYEVTKQDVLDWEAKNGKVPEKAIVLLKFGWGKYFGDMKKAFQTDNLHDTSSFHYPGIGGEASIFLARERKIHAVGCDTPSPDVGNDLTFPAHVALLCDYEVILLENVAIAGALPTTGSRIYIGAIKLENGSGVPVRLFAVVGSGSPCIWSPSSLTLTSLAGLFVAVLIKRKIYIS